MTLTDPGFGRRIRVAKTGSLASVVWNPWIAKSRAMPDFGDDEWPGMICIETVNAADNAVTLPPGAASHDDGRRLRWRPERFVLNRRRLSPDADGSGRLDCGRPP